MRAISTREDVIPVLGTGIQPLLCSYLVYLFKIKFSGSQCQSTGMTPFLAEIILKSQCSYSCGLDHRIQSKKSGFQRHALE
ncbi:hypothetical protein HCR16_05175 [Wolbachia pipientis]|uniref:hypothetical protein n=1 Tax=Wolbachia pipientis TaxID=955 RepID=UPI0015F84943|nr:hypothetical protein [Wolbachia pipientis]MBA8770471.1 hypothetical protein [Wolbachia pipientis]